MESVKDILNSVEFDSYKGWVDKETGKKVKWALGMKPENPKRESIQSIWHSDPFQSCWMCKKMKRWVVYEVLGFVCEECLIMRQRKQFGDEKARGSLLYIKGNNRGPVNV